MIGDANSIVRDGVLRADLCVVGGGPAGISIALRLRNAGLDVLVLESGGQVHDAATQSLNEGEVADETLHSPPDRYRQRRFGGSTTIWGGRCMPLDPIDLRTRPWIQHASWPIQYNELANYYPDANRLCEAGVFEYDARCALPEGMRPIVKGFMPEDFDQDGIERFSCPTDFGVRYREKLHAAANIRVLLNATVTQLQSSTDGTRIEQVTVRTVQGNQFTVQAEQFVLATGGIEVPRLLLSTRDRHPQGLGNAEDLLGRFYMCHIAGTIGSLQLDIPRDHVWHGYDVAEDGTYCRRRIALKPERQQEHGVGNIIFRLHHPRIPDPRHRTGALSAIYLARRFISYEYAKRLADDPSAGTGRWLRHVANLATDPFGTMGFLWHWLRDRSLAERKFPSVIIRPRANLFSLDFHAEQVPNRASRIRLSRDTDALGLPKVMIDWRYADADVRTVSVAFDLLRKEFLRSGLGTLEVGPDEADIDAVIRRDGAYGGHHIGTARMGSSPTMGVVDSNCRVYGVNNLYVAGSAVFPTSSQANPTLTIVALALRLADHLGAEARRVIQTMPATNSEQRAESTVSA